MDAWNYELNEAPQNGDPIILNVGGEPVIAKWYAPWGVWHHQNDPTPEEGDERWGIGADVPRAWMPAPDCGPKLGSHYYRADPDTAVTKEGYVATIDGKIIADGVGSTKFEAQMALDSIGHKALENGGSDITYLPCKITAPAANHNAFAVTKPHDVYINAMGETEKAALFALSLTVLYDSRFKSMTVEPARIDLINDAVKAVDPDAAA